MNVKNLDPFIGQQIKQAESKTLILASLITLCFIAFNFFDLGSYFWAALIFIFSRGLAFIWFARKVIQFVEPYKIPESDLAMDMLNMSNGNPPCGRFLVPKPSYKD